MSRRQETRARAWGHWLAGGLLGTALLLVAPAAAQEAAVPVTEETVNSAVDRAVAWIKSQRNAAGHWDQGESGGQFHGGDTGLALLALLYAGENPLSEEMNRSLKWLADRPLDRTYTIGTRAHVFALVPGRTYRRQLQADLDWLVRNISPLDAPMPGSYHYDAFAPGRGSYDNSNSQYGVLGVWMATDAALTVPASYWELVSGHWMRDQNGDGGWGYTGGGSGEGGSTGSMTAAGLATLYVVLDRLYVDRPRDAVEIAGGIDRALAWFAREFTTENPRGSAEWKYYYLYGVERIGRASGQKYFRDLDWFRVGAAELLRRQRPNGSWEGAGGSGDFAMSDLRNTAFALMFLCHGRAPLLFNKLEHGPRPSAAAAPGEAPAIDGPGPAPSDPGNGDWNEDRPDPTVTTETPDRAPTERSARRARASGRRGAPEPPPPPEPDWNNKMRDVAGLVRYAQGSLERLLNWQIVRLDGPLEDLMEAPVLYMCGRTAWEFTDAEVAKLREYCQRGGLLLGVADRDSAEFAAGFRALAGRMFPEFPLEPVPATHPLFNGEVRTVIEDPPPLLHVSNGLRTLMLLSPQDISEAWHRYQPRSREAHFSLGVNIYLYATDKTTGGSRLRTPYIPVQPADITREIRVARVRYAGRWDPEPYGWRRLANYMNNETGTRLVIAEQGVTLDQLQPDEYRVAHITGAEAFELTDAEREGLRRFLTGGGMLIADATGGATAFDEALSRHLTEALRGTAESLGERSPLITGAMPDGVSLRGVTYRRTARRESQGRDYPRLMVHRLGARLAVVQSPLDLSAGLLGTDVYNCAGYDSASTLRIMRNMLLYAHLSPAEKARLERTP
jgi:hypothetical protein